MPVHIVEQPAFEGFRVLLWEVRFEKAQQVFRPGDKVVWLIQNPLFPAVLRQCLKKGKG